MNTIMKAGIVLGVLVEIWTYVTGFAGWYRDPALQNLFWVVILIQIGVLIWALKRTAAEGRGYGGQVGAGTLISIVGGVIIMVGSYLFTTVVFPNYSSDLAAIQEQALRTAGRSEAQIKQVMDLSAKTSTPIVQSVLGFVGTLVTGVCCSLVIGAFVRAKKA